VYLIFLLFCLLSTVWAGCQKKPDKMLVYGGGTVLRGLNPNLTKNGWNEANSLILSRLFQIGEQGELEPDLVADYTVSPDGLTYRFYLRTGVFWHDGVPFTVEDVDFTLKSIFDPKTDTHHDEELAMVDTFVHAQPNLFVIKLKTPTVSFLSRLSHVAVLPKHILKDVSVAEIDAGAFDRNPVGTGPYRFVEKASDVEWRFAWNEKYYRPSSAPVPKLLLKITPDDDTRVRQMLEGALDVTQIKPQHIEQLLAHPDIVIYRLPSGVWRGMPQNLRRTFLQDPRVRLAISLSLDREALAKEAAMGVARSAYLPVLPSSFIYDTSVFMPGRDIDQARVLLSEAGWEPGTDGVLRKNGARFDYRIAIWKDDVFRREAGELIKRQLAEVGINVVLDSVDETKYGQIGEDMGNTHDTLIGGWSGLLDPDMTLSGMFETGGRQNVMHYSSRATDRLLEQGRKERIQQKRKQVYLQLLTHLYQDAVFIPLVYPDYVFAARRTVQGIKDGVTLDNWYHFPRNAYRWSLSEEK